MRREYIFIRYLIWFFFLLHFKNLNAEESSEDEYSIGCSHLRCENGSRCIKRRFWCKDPPCPGMLYCSKSRKESLKGPPTCDTVRCRKGYTCIVKVRECRWNKECKQQIARCVSEKEYYEGAVSCAGFECSFGKRCILREMHCINPPCKLIRSCAEAADAQIWFDKCKSLNCTSEYECFLRRPENNCLKPSCSHTIDCTRTIEDQLISKYCHGWICPQSQKCVVRIVGFCKGFNCTIKRSCRTFMISSVQHDANMTDKIVEQSLDEKTLMGMESELIRQKLEKKINLQTNFSIAEKKPILMTSTRRSSSSHTTLTTYDTETLLTHQQVATISNPITKWFKSSKNQLDVTLSYPQSWWNYNTLSTNNTTDVIKITSKLAGWSNNATFSTTSLPVEEKIESTTPCDAKKLEMTKKIYITSNDALPLFMVLEAINFIEQNYPIWMKNDPYRTVSLGIKDNNDDAWEYQEPYRILLPPYEPVILVQDTKSREQLFPFYAFNRSFNETIALISFPEITSTDTTTASKTDNISTIVNNYINDSATIKAENFKTNYFDDSFSYYTNLPVMEKTIPPNTQESNNYYDNYEWRPFMNHDYLERNEPQSQAHKQEFKSSVIDFATDNS